MPSWPQWRQPELPRLSSAGLSTRRVGGRCPWPGSVARLRGRGARHGAGVAAGGGRKAAALPRSRARTGLRAAPGRVCRPRRGREGPRSLAPRDLGTERETLTDCHRASPSARPLGAVARSRFSPLWEAFASIGHAVSRLAVRNLALQTCPKAEKIIEKSVKSKNTSCLQVCKCIMESRIRFMLS